MPKIGNMPTGIKSDFLVNKGGVTITSGNNELVVTQNSEEFSSLCGVINATGFARVDVCHSQYGENISKFVTMGVCTGRGVVFEIPVLFKSTTFKITNLQGADIVYNMGVYGKRSSADWSLVVPQLTIVDSTTPLAGAGSLLSGLFSTFGYKTARVSATANVAGTIYVRHYTHNGTKCGEQNYAVGAGAFVSQEVPLYAAFVGVDYVNGAGAQASFAIDAKLIA